MLNIIAAVDIFGAIGSDGKLAWDTVPADMSRFKELTVGHPVIMGRKTWESLPAAYRPLPERTNIVVSRNHGSLPNHPDVIHASTIKSALSIAKELDDEIFIIGGGQIYEQTMALADRIYLTKLQCRIEKPDAYFPVIPSDVWGITDYKLMVSRYPLTFNVYERRANKPDYCFLNLETMKQKALGM